jgi:two-component system cell cycle response regulator DivK
MVSKDITILVAEDSNDIRDMLVRLLQRSGYHVCAATNGQEALAHLHQQAPDLVLLDLSMPELDGWQTAMAIRALPGGKQVPVVAVTAHAMTGDREAILAHGFDAYVSKPLDIRAFLDVITKILQRRPSVE